ncbi:helix-turn-helix transcriptional regulator [Phytohabitans flavus]|uniref:helix-turn-helix transcriptional regulator n=1 Tax=Phytohabitans flavus TaxID=1076124 RepID=UPI001566C379|nr:LuxR C-terminal-related transcriptional regulator [Phytohabitans flavus]
MSARNTAEAAHLWHPEQLDDLEGAIRRARTGEPTTLVVSGPAGVGKTSFLDDLVARAADFTVLAAEGLEDDGFPYSVLAQVGVAVRGGGDVDPFVMAQRLRAVLDSCGGRPVLLRVDDLHWADAESVNALLWLLRRAAGDRLLVAVGARPLDADQHPAWQRWLGNRRQVVRIELSGLSRDQVATLVAADGRAVPEGFPALLWEHTSGNPLYLRALLDEYEPAELADREVLPAPARFARTVAARTGRLAPAATRLLGAVAVLGTGWHPLADAAAVAGLDDSAVAAQQLTDAGLLQVRAAGSGDAVRPAHALIRSAVHQQLPLAERKRLHARAAQVLVDEGQVLDHRLAAANGYDDDLATTLEAYAQRLRTRRIWRVSARYLRGAAAVTAQPGRRRRRWLESLVDTTLIPDLPAARAGLAAQAATDDPAETMLRALLDLADGNPAATVAAAQQVLALAEESVDPVTRYRAGVLLATAMREQGEPADQVDTVLRAAEGLKVIDPCLLFQARLARTFVDEELLGPVRHWASIDPALGTPAAVPVAATLELARRAIAAVHIGLYEVARDDLTEVMRRCRDGILSLADGRIPDGLGYVHYLLGDWSSASRWLHLAHDMRGLSRYLPYLLIGQDRLAEADDYLDRLLPTFGRSPRAGFENALHLLIARGHAGDDPARRREIGARLVGEIGRRVRGPQPAASTVRVLISAGTAALWADRPDLTEICADLMTPALPVTPWARSGASWLRGLAAEATGDRTGALAMLDAATSGPPMTLPLYRAHILADQARLLRATGEEARGRQALRDAADGYRAIGAVGYLARVEAALSGQPGPRAVQDGRAGSRIGLTEREVDVLALVGKGMSYAQIAAELFITRKTVGYHLSNLYAKAGVANRHQLADLARREPGQFAVLS